MTPGRGQYQDAARRRLTPMTVKQFRQRLKRACPLIYTKRMDLSPVWSKSNPNRPK